MGPRGEWLETAITLPEGGAWSMRVEDSAKGIVLRAPGRPDAPTRRELRRAARRMLNLDLDLSEFYERTRDDPDTAWVARCGAGRLLRGPNMFEDLAKLVLTTNCSWSATQRMVNRLIDDHGVVAPDGRRAFPTAQAVARAGATTLRDDVRAGYRAPLLAELSRRVAAGETDPEAWESDVREPAELKRELLALPGVGPYVAENVLRFLGRPHGLGLDSWLRAAFSRRYHEERPVKDRTIARRYARFGAWAGLVLWCDMTRDWFSGDRPDAGWVDRSPG
jgi:3-methyladenine DNA glycosylase/8-oxoguanine DNA glycosylase